MNAGEAAAEPDLVNHPPHYASHPSGQECITFAEWLGFNVGDAFKYIWRCESKGAREQDLRKALWYIDRALANPATVPHRRTADIPPLVHRGWGWVLAKTKVDTLGYALSPLWEVQFVDNPCPNLINARELVAAALEVTP